MTTNQTIDGVTREQVERALDAIEQVGLQDKFIDYAFVRTVKQKLRALLDAPVHPCPVQLDGCDGSCVPAVQLQGEPVAWIKPDVAKTLTKDQCCYAFGSQNPKGTLIPLYAEQPAPVAVVMPERRAEIISDNPELLMAVATWNACLDELKRLNPSL